MPQSHHLVRELNPEQREAVCHTEGPVLVLAGAGSGKTRVITSRIAYLVATERATPSEILAVTFTNKAAAEMRERVASLVGTAAARQIAISTFHSFCVRVLRAEIERLGYRRNFTISSESDARTLLRRSLEDMDGDREAYDPSIFLEQIGMVKNAGLDPAKKPVTADESSRTMEKYRRLLPEIYDRYQSALRAANTVDFDDLLLLTLALWDDHPEVLERYQDRFRYTMVDEYQDTNRVQYRLLRALTSRRRNLCVVGDDDQSIYSWRGADIANILSFEKDYPEACIVKLEENYRSTESILNAANAVIAHNRHRREKKLWSRLGQGRALDRFITADDEGEAKEAVKWLKHIQEKSEARYSDFAVLYRSNIQSRPFELAFRQAGIPYVVVGGQAFYDRAEIRDIVAYLKVIANPRDEASFLRVVNVPRRGIGDVTLHQTHDLCREQSLSLGKGLAARLKQGDLPGHTEAGIRDFLALLTEYRQRFRTCEGGLTAVLQALLVRIGYRDETLRTTKTPAQFEARWSNVEALVSAVAEYEAQTDHPSLAGFLDQSALASDDDRRSPEEERRRGVTLMTIHSAKGLEFPFVFVVGLEEGILPHEKSLTARALEEERRLFYVALTRGMRHVTLFEALSRERHGRVRPSKSSRFLAEIPPELVRSQIRAVADMEKEPPCPRKAKKASRRRR